MEPAPIGQVRTLQEIGVRVNALTPYVINIKDLETTKFKRAKKRELVSGFDIELTLKKSL